LYVDGRSLYIVDWWMVVQGGCLGVGGGMSGGMSGPWSVKSGP